MKSKPQERDPYETLGVAKDADAATIREAYRRKAAAAHPDRPGGSSQEMIAINGAWALLSDEVARERFDQTGDASRPPPLEVLARNTLAGLFDAACEQLPEHVDVLFAMCRKLSQMQSESQEAIASNDEAIRKATKQMARLKWKAKSGHNFLAATLEKRIELARRRNASAKRAIEVADLCVKMLEDFEWEPEMATEASGPVLFESLLRPYRPHSPGGS